MYMLAPFRRVALLSGEAGILVVATPPNGKRRRWPLQAGEYSPTKLGRGGTPLRCVECGAESDQLAAGRRVHLAGTLDKDEHAAEVLMLPPDCAEREFDSFGWERTD
jgi:hypothetical protein